MRNGLSTGEGLIAAVADRQVQDEDGEALPVETGPQDKRLMVVESELGRVLRAASRHGSTLSAVMRCAWDGVPLGIMTKSESMTAAGAHIALLNERRVIAMPPWKAQQA